MDPGFFADPDPGCKSPDPDPNSEKKVRSGFGSGKKTVSETLVTGKKVDIKKNSYLAYLRKKCIINLCFFSRGV